MQGSGVNKTTCTDSQQNFLNENSQRKQYFLRQLYKTIIGFKGRKGVSDVCTHTHYSNA